MRGKRKGRGGRRCLQTPSDLPSDSPKRKDSRIEFQGHLSHASPPITRFFHPQPNDQITSSSDKQTIALDSTEQITLSPIDSEVQLQNSEGGTPANTELAENHEEISERGADPITSSIVENAGNETLEDVRPQSPATPHKIVLDGVEPSLTSPSNALSQLSLLNGALKKTTKSRRKLNPSQTANQITLTEAGPKLNCCTQPKSTAVPETKTSSVSSANGSQHKLTEYFPVRRSVRKTKKTVLEERQRTLEEAVMMCKEEGLEIHNFEGKGRGIVARRQFAKGEFVVEYAGELIKMDEARDREKLYATDQNTGCYMYYFKYRNQQYCVDATPESDRLGRLVNHSRNGNLMTKTITIDNTPRLVLIAKEDIQSGEEVTYDYGDRSKESLKYHPWLAS